MAWLMRVSVCLEISIRRRGTEPLNLCLPERGGVIIKQEDTMRLPIRNLWRKRRPRSHTRPPSHNAPAACFGPDGKIDDCLLDKLAFNEKMAELGKLAAGMVHELNTPLSVIVSATQMILREDGLPDSIKEMVERINEETQRLSHFTRGILSFARTREEVSAEVDVNQVLGDVLVFLKYEVQKRSVKVIEDLDYRIPSILADGNRLKQIFVNLIMNALQAMENGGVILVRTVCPDDRSVEVQIADTGTGIREEAVGRIFEPFFTTKEPGTGTGLGLFITKTIVERLGGGISVQSAYGEGTTFTISFPVAPR